MSKNLSWHAGAVPPHIRSRQLRQRPCALWFTGLSGAGKSTVARLVEEKLFELGYVTVVLDGDNIRHGLCRDLGFGTDDRIENIRRVGEVTKLFLDSGIIVLAALISPFEQDRRMVRTLLGTDFIEVFVDTPLAVCEQRDPKGLYSKARKGEITNFTGIDSPYERPVTPDILIGGTSQSPESCADSVIAYLRERGRLN
ncbi:adenylyl-sulfate kinase [Pseudomonas fluorescens]|uniref:Adenylyl-sulfate kinase n=1 Tax=Pseudomonas fluorescens TaxID=294 RepID=A0A944DI69_PSEFL|nr:adenylyl-sulfate kinase [Pseudomonas fluorescens]MBT2294674.1 adenylyl-sulfate kinase [Pseudomonas fluorescens]MBT2306670.1 adenylyl-sulfate kinase [Pseudomonas fluorescens]MBT2316420.1 adenylyl-sulfate kinase [Pseudomonas fluorescens]MBT2330212.1 adenylyl-sulfate kinase [Pseudomonas fluorescens]MBT2342925.1 adenylyl-sulfate kinase [Pseudomonas fluorescens]